MTGGRKRNSDNTLLKLNTTGTLSEAETLAFVLRLINPKADADKIAAALLMRFDRLADVFDAPAELLLDTPGVDARTASALAAYPDIFRAYLESKNLKRERIIDTQSAFNAVQGKFFGRKVEIVVLIILDSKGYLKYMGVVNEGSVRGVPLYIREIIRLCLLYDADTVYIAHNHPSGNCTPSKQDTKATKEIELALSSIDVILSDHFIFTDDDYLSMRASGMLQALRGEIAAMKRQLIK